MTVTITSDWVIPVLQVLFYASAIGSAGVLFGLQLATVFNPLPWMEGRGARIKAVVQVITGTALIVGGLFLLPNPSQQPLIAKLIETGFFLVCGVIGWFMRGALKPYT